MPSTPQDYGRMGLFYDTYAGNEKLSPLVREIGWTFDLFSWRVQGRTRGPILPHPYEDENCHQRWQKSTSTLSGTSVGTNPAT
jgi:hypothetical protein